MEDLMKRFAIAAVAAVGLFASAGAAHAACTLDAAAGLNTRGKGVAYPGAEGRPWFVSGQTIAVAGKPYDKYGLPRVFGAMDLMVLEKAGVFGGVTAFAETGSDREVIYVPVSASECTFQPYQIMR
jgi:opacity protein-like surface antigen